MGALNWIAKNKCLLLKAGFAIFLAAVIAAIVALFMGTGGTAGGGLLALFAKLGVAAGVAKLIINVAIVMLSIGISGSFIGDWIVCVFLNQRDCCNAATPFWRLFGKFVQSNGGSTALTPAQYQELVKEFNKAKGDLETQDKEAIETFLEENEPEEE